MTQPNPIHELKAVHYLTQSGPLLYYLTSSRRAGKRVRGGADILPNIHAPPTPPTPLPRLGCAHATCGQLIAVCTSMCVYGWGCTSSPCLGAGRSYTHPIVSRLGRAQVSSTPHPHSPRFCHNRVNVVQVNVAFGLMSHSG